VQHQEFLVEDDALPLLPELREQVPQPSPPGHVEAEGLGEVFLRVLGGVGADEVARGDGDPAALEVDPGVVHPPVGLVHLAERAPEPAAPGPVPVVVQEAVAQLVGQQADQHGPGDLVLPPLADHVALLDLDRLGIARIDAGDPGPKQHAIAPVADPGDQQQPADPGQRARDEVAAGGVLAAPGAGVHRVVHAAPAVGTLALEQILLVPALRPVAPGTVGHRVLHPAAAGPVAPRIHPEPLGRLERRGAGVALLVDVHPAPGAVRVPVGHDPAAVVALGAGDVAEVAPLLRPAAVGAVGPVALELVAADAVELLRRGALGAALTRAHAAPSPPPPAAR
jgi:hypothetical protein